MPEFEDTIYFVIPLFKRKGVVVLLWFCFFYLHLLNLLKDREVCSCSAGTIFTPSPARLQDAKDRFSSSLHA